MISRAIRIGAALLGLAAGTGFGASVVIDDSGDGNPTVVTDLPNLLVTPGFEKVTISGTLPASVGQLPTGARQVVFNEPANDFNTPYSDLVLLDIEGAITTAGGLQSIRLEFDSDASGSVNPLPNIPTVFVNEDPTHPDMSAQLQVSPGLTIVAISDLTGSEPTPLPASAWSGLALLGGLATWRIVRHRQARVATV